MKRFHSQLRASRLGQAYRRLRARNSKPARASLPEEMEMGAVIGFFAATALALHFAADGLSAALLVFVSALGIFVGAVIGAILWIGSAQLPEDAVRAPAPGQGRGKRRH